MIYLDNNSIDGIEDVRSTTLWANYATKIRRRYKRFSPNKRRDFNIMLDNIKESIVQYELLHIDLKKNPRSIEIKNKIEDLDAIITDYIEVLTSELMLVILEG